MKAIIKGSEAQLAANISATWTNIRDLIDSGLLKWAKPLFEEYQPSRDPVDLVGEGGRNATKKRSERGAGESGGDVGA